MKIALTPVVAVVVSLHVVAAAEGQTTTRVSLAPDGSPPDVDCDSAAISGDGDWVAFVSAATNLAPVDATFNRNVFVVDRATGTVSLESVSSAGVEADGPCFSPRISSDGRYLVFDSEATNLVAGEIPPRRMVYLRDRATGTTTRVSRTPSGGFPGDRCYVDQITDDGRFIAYESSASDIVAQVNVAGFLDVFTYDTQVGATDLASVADDEQFGNGNSLLGDLSQDGRFVVFESDADNLVTGDQNDHFDIFLRDRQLGTTTRVTMGYDGLEPTLDARSPRISADGRWVVYDSQAGNLAPNDSNYVDVFLWDRITGVAEVESLASDGTPGDDESKNADVSDDARFIVFESSASNFAPFEHSRNRDIFVRDRLLGTTEWATTIGTGSANDGNSYGAVCSADGRAVAFRSSASDLVPGDSGQGVDVFVREWPRSAAAWSNYGTGFAGRYGVPAFTAEDAPHLGMTLDLDIENSAGSWTFGFLFVGVDAIDVPTSLGGELLVLPLLIVAVPLPPTGWVESDDLPNDPTLAGLPVYTQVLELDPWAKRGWSFTAGLELDLGY